MSKTAFPQVSGVSGRENTGMKSRDQIMAEIDRCQMALDMAHLNPGQEAARQLHLARIRVLEWVLSA